MIPFPSIQIRQQYGKIGIDADLGQYTIRQPKATLEIQTTAAQLEIESPPMEFEVDQNRAWDAINGGKYERFNNRIYSQMPDILLEGIALMVEKGNRMAAIHVRTNAIADSAESAQYNHAKVQYFGPASFDNVDVYITTHKPIIRMIEGGVDIYSRPNRPEIEYERGKLDIYMRQYAQLEIIPPQVDTKR
ncbi:DUF6470 family protein [Paenibacillus sp. J2TS4]|uniref:DUF6470 family protein n=1 Tax=Paenibacillus sp. J2TS4 TaxID=2807194 RepID=UPI001B10F101|nr:DUF6470 family protein [Paenibacillus sp. J2TS4]GIP35598.1 hypothetical protein J2TS4_48080 [Paenibacillus sp. J2TS4]